MKTSLLEQPFGHCDRLRKRQIIVYMPLNVWSFSSCAALKKPAITQKHDEVPDALVGGGAGPGVGAADGPAAQGLDQPRLQQDRVEARPAMIAPPGIVRQAEKAVVFEEDNKAGIKADELGEQQRHLRGTECSAFP